MCFAGCVQLRARPCARRLPILQQTRQSTQRPPRSNPSLTKKQIVLRWEAAGAVSVQPANVCLASMHCAWSGSAGQGREQQVSKGGQVLQAAWPRQQTRCVPWLALYRPLRTVPPTARSPGAGRRLLAQLGAEAVAMQPVLDEGVRVGARVAIGAVASLAIAAPVQAGVSFRGVWLHACGRWGAGAAWRAACCAGVEQPLMNASLRLQQRTHPLCIGACDRRVGVLQLAAPRDALAGVLAGAVRPWGGGVAGGSAAAWVSRRLGASKPHAGAGGGDHCAAAAPCRNTAPAAAPQRVLPLTIVGLGASAGVDLAEGGCTGGRTWHYS